MELKLWRDKSWWRRATRSHYSCKNINWLVYINRYCWTRLYLNVCDVCEVCVCTAPPLVQCTYIGPTVPIHNFLLCFKCIYLLKRPPPLLFPPVCKGRTHPSCTPTADALRQLRKGVLSSIWLLFRRGWRRIIQRQEWTDVLCSSGVPEAFLMKRCEDYQNTV